MAGEAKTTKFMLGTATVMLGPSAEVFDLTPEEHSVGMTKNVSITSEPAYTDLTQGVKNSNVFSVMTSNAVRAALEVYEYTAANMLYAQGLDGSAFTAPTGASVSVGVTNAAAADIDVDTGDGANFTVGDYIVVEDGAIDKVYVRQIASIATDTITVSPAFVNAIPAGSAVRASSLVAVGSKDDTAFLGCKIVGVTAENEPMTLIFPKVRVTAGFNDAQYATFNGSQGFALL